MQGMFPVKGTIFVKFQLFLDIPAVLFGGIVSPLAFRTLQSHQLYSGLFTGHNPLLTRRNLGFYPVNTQNVA
jgi:hypothetical protein